MKRIRHALLTHFALGAALCCGTADVPFVGSSSARAQQVEESRRSKTPTAGPVIPLPPGQVEQTQSTQVENTKHAATRKWEYCTLTGGSWVDKGFISKTPAAMIQYFPNTREQIEGATHEDAHANAVAKLGEEGWEMIGIREMCDNCFPVFYFKRAK